MSTKLFVGNITRGSGPGELKQLFQQYGDVAECDIISDYGFVHFHDPAQAKAALDALHGHNFNNQKLKVEISTSYVRKKAGDGNMSSESCYVCGRAGHWAKNCPQVPPHERDKQNRRAEKSRRGGRDSGPPPRERRMRRDYYDDYEDDYPLPPRRRRPPPGYYDDYDDFDYYPRRRLPPRYYRDPYDDYDDYPPPRRYPPYYRAADPYPSRRAPLDYDDYPPPRLPAAAERLAPTSVAAPSPAPPVYYDFADDNVDKLKAPQQPEVHVDPLAMQHSNPELTEASRPSPLLGPRAPGPDRVGMDYFRRAPRPY